MSELDAIGRSLVRGVSKKVDATFFGNAAASATTPAGIRNAAAFSVPNASGTVTVAGILDAIGVVNAAGGNPDVVWVASADLTAIRKAVVAGGYAISDPTAPGVERVGGCLLVGTNALSAGTALVAQSNYISFAVRRDAEVSFSEHSAFGVDGVSARVTMRVDWAPSDPAALYIIKP